MQSERAETPPSFAKATAGLRQPARFDPTASPMLGAGQREIKNQKLKTVFRSFDLGMIQAERVSFCTTKRHLEGTSP
jgi:hypothetical protein